MKEGIAGDQESPGQLSWTVSPMGNSTRAFILLVAQCTMNPFGLNERIAPRKTAAFKTKVILLSGAALAAKAVSPSPWSQKDLPLECMSQT